MSAVQQQSEQLPLSPDWDESVLVASERARGVFSGSLLLKYDPDKHQLILDLLASEDFNTSQIARATKSSRNLISGIRLHQSVEIDRLRAKLARTAGHVAELCQERQIALLTDPEAKLSLRDLAVTQGVAVDKMQVLTGGVTSRLEVVRGDGPGHDDFEEEMRSATGLPGGFPAPKQLDPGVVDAPEEVVAGAAMPGPDGTECDDEEVHDAG